MNEIPPIPYKGHLINYQENLNEWDIYLVDPERTESQGELVARRASLKGAKEYLDRKMKHTAQFPRHKAFFYEWDRVEELEIIGNCEPEKGKVDHCWIVADGKRSKKALRHLYTHNDANQTVVGRINAMYAEIGHLSEEIRKAQKGLTSYKPIDFNPQTD